MSVVRNYVFFVFLSAVIAFTAAAANSDVELGRNLVLNPGFETNNSGWSTGSGISRDTTSAHSGSASIKLNPKSAGTYIDVSCLAGRKLTASAWANTAGSDTSTGGAVLEVKCFNIASKTIGSIRSNPVATNGTWKKIELTANIPINTSTIKIGLLNTSAADTVWFDDVSGIFPNELLFRTMIREPNYRGTIFDGQDRKIIVGAEVFATDALPISSLAVRLELLNADKKVIVSTLPKEVLDQSWQNMGISIPEGVAGKLSVRCSLINKESKNLYKQTLHTLNVSPEPLPKVYFDSSNKCIVEGKPVFPIGIFTQNPSSQDLDRLSEIGINTVVETDILSKSLAEQADFFNDLHGRGIMGIFSLSDRFNPKSLNDWSNASSVVAELVNANKDNPGLLAWHVSDGQADSHLVQAESLYSQITALDRNHPYFYSLEGIQDYSSIVNISDVAGIGVYPVWQRYLEQAGAPYMPIFGSQTRVAAKTGMYSRPVWMIGEAGKFPQTQGSIAPSAQQMLCEAYGAIVNGARGVLFSDLTNLKLDGEAQWQSLTTVSTNLKAIEPIVMGEDLPEDQIATCTNEKIECITRQTGDDVYILAVNTSASTVNADFTIPETLTSKKGHAVVIGIPGSAITTQQLNGNTLSDSLVAYGTKVYRLTPSLLDDLKNAQKPNFKKGHTLPRLTYWLGGSMQFDIMKELTENWGYAFSKVVAEHYAGDIANPNSELVKICELAKTDPDRYPIAIITAHYWMTYGNWNLRSDLPESAWCHTDTPGTVRTRTRTMWSSSSDARLGELRQCADLPENAHARVYKCIKSAGSKDNRPVPEGNDWWVLATDAELDASPGQMIWSPEAPTSIFEASGKTWAEPIADLKSKYPTIKTPIILNGAEYGLGVLGFGWYNWKQDPQVWKAIDKSDALLHYWNYISSQKLRQELPIAEAFREVTPDRDLYINYGCSAGGLRQTNNPGWVSWGYDYTKMRATTDLPSTETYYTYEPGWTKTWDWLSRVTNQAAQQIALGDPLSYDFLSAGWRSSKNQLAAGISDSDTVLIGNQAWDAAMPQPGKLQIDAEVIEYSTIDFKTKTVNITKRGADGTRAEGHLSRASIYKLPEYYVSDPEMYMGFLKMRYALGSVGSCLFYGIPEENDPHWLWQFIFTGHVHALYSHLEEYLRNGDLLPGPDNHRWSRDLPAYEFPTGNPWTRVVARKKKSGNDWLIAAWAQDGVEKTVGVNIPELGAVSVHARKTGSVYTATLKDGKPVLKLVDVDAMNPSAGLK